MKDMLLKIGLMGFTMIATDMALPAATLTHGMFYTPLANGQLSVGPDGQLSVSGFGSNGVDGFSVDISHSQGWSGRLSPMGFGSNGVVVGRLVDVNDSLMSEQQTEFINGSWFGSGRFPAGSGLRMEGGDIQIVNEIHYEGRVLERTQWVTSSTVSHDFRALLPPSPCGSEAFVCRYFQQPDLSCWRFCYPSCGGTGWYERVICFLPATVRTHRDISRYTLTGASITGMVFQSTAMQMFGNENTGLGQATLQASEGMLKVGNIGDTGLDGVLIALSQPAEAFSMKWGSLDANNTAGAQLLFSAEGSEVGQPSATLGDVRLQHNGQQVEVRPDFKPLSNAGYRAEIRRKGEVVHTFQGPNGVIAAMANRWPGQLSVLMGITPCGIVEWGEVVLFTTQSNQQFNGDEMRIEPLNVSPAYRVVRDVRVRARGILEIPIINQFTFYPRLVCPSNLVVECMGASGTSVPNYNIRGTNFCSTPTITCIPPVGSAFGLGTTPVNCTATDSCGQRAECSFSVTVIDTIAPYIFCPSNIVTMSLSPTGTVVHFRPRVSDWCDETPTVVCQPPSGSGFQIGTTPVMCTATDDNGNSASCQFEVTISPAATLSAVLPPFGRFGDFIMIEGDNFPSNVNDISVMLPYADTFIPLRAVDATSKRIVARLGPVPPDAMPGPLVIAQGTGIQNGETWAFRRPPGPGIAAPGTFQPVYAPPVGASAEFFSGPPQNGVMILGFDGLWPSNTVFSIHCALDSLSAGVHVEVESRRRSFPDAETTVDFAVEIGEATQAAAASIGVEVIAIAEELGQTKARLTLSFKDGSIDAGQVVVRAALPGALQLVRAFPRASAAGDLIALDGSGFGDDPRDLVLVLKDKSERMFPLDVLQVEENTILAQMGDVPPEVLEGAFVLMKGEGYRLTPEAEEQLMATEPPSFWLPGEEAPPVDVWARRFPAPPPPPGSTCLNGWPDPLVLDASLMPPGTIEVRICGLFIEPTYWIVSQWCKTVILNYSSLFELGEQIAAIVRSSQFNTEVEVTELPGGKVQLRTYCSLRPTPSPPLCWDRGYLSVCWRPILELPGEEITIIPREAWGGQILTITGRNFGEDSTKIGLSLRDENSQRAIPLRVLSVSDTWMTARLGMIPPDMKSGTLLFTRGYGASSRFTPTLPGTMLRDDARVWRSTWWTSQALQKLDLNASAHAPGELRFFSGPPNANGAFELLFNGTWPSNSSVKIEIAAREFGGNVGQITLNAPSVAIIGEDGLNADVIAIANFIRSALWQQVLVLVDTKVEQIGADSVKLTVSLPKGQFVEGILIAGILPPLPDVTISQVTPLSAKAGDMITLTGSGFGTNTNHVMVAVRDTQAHSLIPIHVEQATDTTLVGRLGPVPSNVIPGPIVVALGDGSHGKIQPLWGEAKLLNDVLVWRGNDDAITQSPVQFNPIHSIPPLTTRCIHSEPDPVDPFRSLCLILDECPTRIAIGVQCNVIDLEGPTPGVGVSGMMAWIYTNSLMHCADIIADLIRRSIEERQGDAAIVEVVPLPDGRMKISIRPRWTLRGGRLEGSISVCFYAPGVVPVFTATRFAANEIVLQFPTAAGLRYTLLFRPDLNPQSEWTPVATIVGDGQEQSFKHQTNPQMRQGFFQMRIE